MIFPSASSLVPGACGCLRACLLLGDAERAKAVRIRGITNSTNFTISHHASAYSGEPLAASAVVIWTSCVGRRHPALHHVAIHITHPDLGMTPAVKAFTSLHHLTQMLTGQHVRGVERLGVPGQPLHALAICNACHYTISQVTKERHAG